MRKLAIFLMVAVIVAQPPAAGAQAGRGEGATISVRGRGHASAEPDMALLRLGVRRQADTAAGALAQVARASAAMLEELAGLGIAARDMQTSELSLEPVYVTPPGSGNAPPRLVGYRAGNVVRVRLRQLDRLGEVLDRAVARGADSLGGLRLEVSDPAPLLAQARAAAVRDAMARAALMARTAGVELGCVLSISEGGAGPVIAEAPAMMRAMADTMPLAGGEVSYDASVSMLYAIRGPGEGPGCR